MCVWTRINEYSVLLVIFSLRTYICTFSIKLSDLCCSCFGLSYELFLIWVILEGKRTIYITWIVLHCEQLKFPQNLPGYLRPGCTGLWERRMENHSRQASKTAIICLSFRTFNLKISWKCICFNEKLFLQDTVCLAVQGDSLRRKKELETWDKGSQFSFLELLRDNINYEIRKTFCDKSEKPKVFSLYESTKEVLKKLKSS